MSDHFQPPGAAKLSRWIERELEGSRSIFGIPEDLWFRPSSNDRFATLCHGHTIRTPIGVAAGPHTQLAQNIVVAWLCGARVVELKTVQNLDRIEVVKPCIDMQDEGTNIEWSQELTVEQSYHEYLTAWLIIHALHTRLGFPGDGPEVLFDVSVGYDLEGLRQPKMRWFLEHVADAGDAFDACRHAVSTAFPEVLDLAVPNRISDCVTVSTLHGCPPNEIGAIAEHLMHDWGLHTAVKLNPTLVGYDTVREILVNELGWSQIEPHRPAFDADIAYPDAEALLGQLTRFAADRGVDFGVKLSNTLPVVNHRSALAGDEPASYLSGRPLHALTVELARRFSDTPGGGPAISFAGGADAFNTPKLLAGGLRPVTVCSDVLRPGGYLRLLQYIEEIDAALDRTGAADLDGLILREAGEASSAAEAARTNLERYADSLRRHPEFAASSYRRNDTKTSRPLGLFDCIAAPCSDACGVDQGVPEYMRAVAANDIDAAARIISRDNPLPSILGRACHHPCENVCTRTHLDRPLAIREIKRFVTDNAPPPPPPTSEPRDTRVAVVGAGPCGLAAATDLARAGVQVTIFEARDVGGGMVSATIPGYRASDAVVRRDLEAVAALGVDVVTGVRIGEDLKLQDLFDRGYDHVVVGAGAQRGIRLGLDGEDSGGVFDGLDFLRLSRAGQAPNLGRRVAVIGGGDVAMDCARSARRIGSDEVEIVYRRTTDQMPAHPEEVRDLIAEGCSIRELVAPRGILTENGSITALECAVMTLGQPDASGRPRPVEVPGESLTLKIDTLIIAIGQRADLSVFAGGEIDTDSKGFVTVDPETLESSLAGVWVGGDLRTPGPSNIVEACGDGRRIARSILDRETIAPIDAYRYLPLPEVDAVDLLRRRSHRAPRVEVPRRPSSDRPGFVEVVETLGPDAAAAEAARCLDCDIYCATCVSVCPNRAIFSYRVAVEGDNAPEQRHQVAVVSDFCNHCGNCVTFCPTSGRPWADKPRIFINQSDFRAETDNAFRLVSHEGIDAIQGIFAGEVHELVGGEDLRYRAPGIQARLDRHSGRVLEIEAAGEASLEPCFVLRNLLAGLKESMPHLWPESD